MAQPRTMTARIKPSLCVCVVTLKTSELVFIYMTIFCADTLMLDVTHSSRNNEYRYGREEAHEQKVCTTNIATYMTNIGCILL